MAAEFDIAAFRAAFPQFASVVLYPDATIQAAADSTSCLLGINGCGCDTLSWQLMVAHLLVIGTRAASGNGGSGGIVTSASIDRVSVGLSNLMANDPYTFWLSSTPYGVQLLAMLTRCSSGGIYVGGRAERSAFRSVGGRFPNRGRIL